MWVKENPTYGSQIRVNRGIYYHHGIYVSDDCVIQFAAKSGSEISAMNAIVHQTTLLDFAKGMDVEVRKYTSEEEYKLRSPQEIVNYAFSSLGNKGYDVLSNNCEHFSNDCAFGEKKSNQVSEIISMLFGG